MVTIRTLLILAGLPFMLMSCNQPPNVILIMADDMGAECLSPYGGTSYQTPNLELMAENGLVVSHCISQPLCTPSRVKLMTGLYNSRNYTHFGYLDTAWLNLGTVMKEAGYRTCISGKWQLNGLSYKKQFPEWNDPSRPNQMGFDEYCLWQLTHGRGEGERFSDPLIEQNGRELETGPDDYGPDIFCRYILDFIDRNQDEPFFVYYPMVLVHEPFVPTPDSENWADRDARYLSDTSYFGDMVSYADKIVGQIMKKLEDTGIRKRTLVIFTGDNGTDTHVVSHTRSRSVRGAKGNTITDGVHVPLMISWPGKIRKAALFNGLIEFTDFFATLADLVGREVQTDGHSFLPLLERKRFKARETAKVHYDPRWGAYVNRYRNSFVQTMDYKLYQDGKFFNIKEDMLEQQPLAMGEFDPAARETYEMLHDEIFNVPASPPNLVLIITDDQGYGDLSLHGNTILETPHLDAIGISGTRLDNFHVSPVCAPTRAAVLTGRRPMSTGAFWVTRGGEVMDHEEYTIAEVLKDNGYSTGYFGKWHNGAHHPHHPMSQGFDEFYGFTAGHWNRYFNPELEHNGAMIKAKGYIADLFTDFAIRYIRDKKDEPFFCYLAYNTPHSPFQVPDSYYDMYIDKVEEPDSALRIMNASVYGMVRNIDDNVGRLMGTLRELGIEEQTMVVFLTDNGPNTERFNADMKGRKGWVNDGGVRVPCFIQWKGHVPDNRVVTTMTAHIDLLPTLVNMMGVAFEPQREIHGMDLSPLIFGVDKEQDRILFTHVNHGQEVKPAPGAVRSQEWRFTYSNPDQPELTRRSDAGEIHNLAGSMPELTDSMMALYRQWFDPFLDHEIPPIPVGVTDSVILPAHEGFIEGSAEYHWSANGWSNDWITSLDGERGSVSWPIQVVEGGSYDCQVKFTSPSGTASLAVDFSGRKLHREVPEFIPEKDRNYSRIDRPAEAIGQTWGRVSMGKIKLDAGRTRVTMSASDTEVEILELIILKTIGEIDQP